MKHSWSTITGMTGGGGGGGGKRTPFATHYLGREIGIVIELTPFLLDCMCKTNGGLIMHLQPTKPVQNPVQSRIYHSPSYIA